MEGFEYYLTRYNAFAEHQLIDLNPQNLYDPIQYILGFGGKKLRPLLVLLSNSLYGGDINLALPASFGIELFHNFTLIHDDIMDNADKRRGRPTVHSKFGRNVAILSGDSMFAHAYSYILQSFRNHPSQHEALDLFTQTAIRLCEGQQMDVDFEQMQKVEPKEYIIMIGGKTAVLIGCALGLGCLSAEGPGDDARSLFQFGHDLGIAFQIHDDWLDCFGSEDLIGKKIGGDILQNKKTLLWIHTNNHPNKNFRKKMLEAINWENDAKIEEYKKLFVESGASESVLSEKEAYYRKSLTHLNSLDITKDQKEVLIAFAQTLMDRKL